MKIIVLGTSAATSMPLVFCNCIVCKQSRKLGGKNIRKRSSIVINDELLIDLGPDSINACNMYGIDAGKIRYLLQTHSHSDHFDSKHDQRVEALNYIISCNDKSIFYGTDMLEISEEAWKLIEKCRFDVVFLDQTYGKWFNAGGHPDAGMVSDYVKAMKVKGIIDDNSLVYATHISHEGNATHEEMEKEAKSNGYHVAYDGMKLLL